MGISMTSQKRKEEEEIEREEDADDADFEHQQHDEKFLDAFVNAVQEAMTEMAVRKVVRMTRKTLRPSTPR